MAVALAALLLLAVVVPPFVNANRFRARLAQSVSGSIGRPVSMGNVKIRLLPLPGFEIENFVIADDPAYSAEPLLRAETVVARLRLTSLWRGRLEIARLSFNYPSLNLVRNGDGQWNIEALLRHASQLQAAPTAKKKPEGRPRFPYIEADSGRINFKIMQDKKAHVLVDADFALWLESENQWNMRLEARPTRTDANLGDTGTLRVEGSFVRADKIEQTPVKLRIELEKSQLGQLTTLIYGRDRGWRGNVTLSAQLQGTPQDFTSTAKVRIDDFRRYDIASDNSFRIDANCEAKLSGHPEANDPAQDFFACNLPVGDGSVRLKGYGEHWSTSPQYLSLSAESVPLASMARLFRHAKRDTPADLTAAGVLNAYFSKTISGGQAKWTGQGSIAESALSSVTLAQVIKGGNVRFGFSEVELTPEGPTSAGVKSRLERSKSNRLPSTVNIFTIDPFTIALGGARPVAVAGVGSNEGLKWQIKGDADIHKLFGAARLLGLQSQTRTAFPEGAASLDLTIANAWTGFGAPLVTGNSQLRRVKAAVNEFAAPLEIASANLVLTPQEISVQKLAAALFGTRTQLDGTLAIPRVCTEEPCPVRFDLHASELNLDELNRILNPKFQPTNWLGQRTPASTGIISSELFNIDLIGQLSADRVILKSLVANNLIAHVAKNNGSVNLTDVHADLLGGKQRSNWHGEFGLSGATYAGDGSIQHASLTAVSALTHDNWGTGSINANFKLSMSGTDAAALRDSAAGSLEFVWEDGSVRRLAAPQFPSGLQFARWTGTAKLSSGAIEWGNSTIDSPSGRIRISGTATLNRELKLNLLTDTHEIQVTGTLERPELNVQPATPSSNAASHLQDASAAVSKPVSAAKSRK
ncbi:MAG: AsmA [Candidatus Angelobacter sp.]|nr:AsmA [Candidatus Angelobacter sp.]